jgi:F-type H+-transporting ATPase subunit epsilon
LITSLKPGPITLTKQGGDREVFYISGGYLEVQPNMVKVLADTVQRAADLDEASAQAAVKAAEKALNEKGADFDYGSAAARLAEAAAQLRTVQQIRKKFGG